MNPVTVIVVVIAAIALFFLGAFWATYRIIEMGFIGEEDDNSIELDDVVNGDLTSVDACLNALNSFLVSDNGKDFEVVVEDYEIKDRICMSGTKYKLKQIDGKES